MNQTLPFTQSHSCDLKRACLELKHASLNAYLDIKAELIHFPSYHIRNIPQNTNNYSWREKNRRKQNESQKTSYSYQQIPAKYTDVQYKNKSTPTASESEN